MTDRDREKRRAKRLQKQKKKRANASRPGRDAPVAASDPLRGRSWPTGESWLSDGWDTPGARVYAVLSRSNADGATVVAVFELDRSGPGLVAASARGGLRREHVSGECARISEATGLAMIEAAPGLVAGLVEDARLSGIADDPPGAGPALALLEGLDPIDPGVPFGPEGEASTEAPERTGWFAGIRRRLFG